MNRNKIRTSDPRPPAAVPHTRSGITTRGACARHALLSARSAPAIVAPMASPPPSDASVPTSDMPPFVPGGTGLSVVMRMGGVRERMPSSEASVSPRQHAKWLRGAGGGQQLRGWRVHGETHPRVTYRSARLQGADGGGARGHHWAKSYGVCAGSARLSGAARRTRAGSEVGA